MLFMKTFYFWLNVNYLPVACVYSNYGQADAICMTVSTSRVTGGSDIIEKAWDLLELLSATCVPAPMVEIILSND